MGGGASRASGSLPVRPQDALQLAQSQRTAHFVGLGEQQRTMVVRRGCALHFGLKVAKKLQAGSAGVTVKLEVTDLRRGTDARNAWPCEVSANDTGQVTVRIEVPVDAPFAVFELNFTLASKSAQEVTETLRCEYLLVVLYNPRSQSDESVFLRETEQVESLVDQLEGAVVLCDGATRIRRLWHFNQNLPHTLRCLTTLIKTGSHSVRSTPHSAAKWVGQELVKLYLVFMGRLRKNKRGHILGSMQSTLGMLEGSGTFGAFVEDKLGDHLLASSYGSVSDSDESEDEAFAAALGLKRYEELSAPWVLIGLYCSLMRLLGIPSRMLTLTNILSAPGEVMKEDPVAICKGGQSALGRSSPKSPSNAGPVLRPFLPCAEVWVKGGWHLVRFELDDSGKIGCLIQPQTEAQATLAPLLNPVVVLPTEASTPVRLLQRSEAWTCDGPSHALLDRTSAYCPPASAIPPARADDMLNNVSFEVKNCGIVGEPIVFDLQCAAATTKLLQYSIVINAITPGGVHIKQVRSFSGAAKPPLKVSRVLEFEDCSAYVDHNIPIIECICVVSEAGAATDDDFVMQDFGDVDLAPARGFYTTRMVVPTHIGVDLKRAPGNKEDVLVTFHVSDKYKAPVPKLQDLGIQLSPVGQSKRPDMFVLEKCDYLAASKSLQVVESTLRAKHTPKKADEAPSFPWVLTVFDEKLPAGRKSQAAMPGLTVID